MRWLLHRWSGLGFPRTGSKALSAIALAAGRKEAKIVRDAIAQYLGKTDPSSVKGALADLQDRVANVERKLASLGRLVG